ncbi:MAG: YjbH domain-containing protein [Verrucomicrobia bacterium]|nr:YjbH domain-containing protein [Verrucomicrobiota bacterium]
MSLKICSFLLISTLAAGDLFDDLSLVDEIDKKNLDKLPFIYNFSMIGGYFNMPSGRVAPEGTIGVGGARAHPYNVYGLNFQYFDRIELALNYRVYTGVLEGNFGHEGFGDDAERIANGKIVLNLPSDGFPDFPSFAVGADDFIGTKRFNSQYVLMTKEWLAANLETTLGWGRRRIKGFFGGVAWTPLRQTHIPILNDITLVAEYDAIDYKNHPHEHPRGRDVKSRINAGATYVAGDLFQLSVCSLRGRHLGASASMRYPLGTTEGFIKKTQDPLYYRSPIDTEPLGLVRPKKTFAHELGYALGAQRIDLYSVRLSEDNTLWIKVVNNAYREESAMRERLERVLAALTPSDITKVIVVDEADGVPAQSYVFRTEDLYRYRQKDIGKQEMEALSPLRDAIHAPPRSERLYHRTKPIWAFTVQPRFLSFFGSASGKFKYNVGVIARPEGYLFDEIYYETQVGYQIKSSMFDMKAVDRLNPSQLPNVRTDTIRYFQTNTFDLEMAYLQKSFNIGKGWFFRLAGGYFEAAYGGVATELLYYPLDTSGDSSWAVGLEEATLLKRRYKGLAFTRKIRKLKGHKPTYEHFIGQQYFFDLYYTLKPWNLDLKMMVGQFLAKDRGVRFEMTRWFPSGLSVSLWYTITNGHDKLNGHTYFDKGFAFGIPLDFFLRRSSRTYAGYAMSAWLRDVGAFADSGRQLYNTLRLERNK